jgi:hypothetical protein
LGIEAYPQSNAAFNQPTIPNRNLNPHQPEPNTHGNYDVLGDASGAATFRKFRYQLAIFECTDCEPERFYSFDQYQALRYQDGNTYRNPEALEKYVFLVTFLSHSDHIRSADQRKTRSGEMSVTITITREGITDHFVHATSHMLFWSNGGNGPNRTSVAIKCIAAIFIFSVFCFF